MLTLALLLVLTIGLQLLIPQILRSFIDSAVGVNEAHLFGLSLSALAVLFIGAALVQQVASVTATYVSENVAWTATNGLRADLAAHCLNLDMPFHNAHTPGDMIERVDGDVSALANFFSQFVIKLGANAVLLTAVVVLMLREDARVGAVLLGFVIVAITGLVSLRKITVPLWRAEREAFSDYWGFVEERLNGTEDIRSLGAERYTLHRFDVLYNRAFRAIMRSSFGGNAAINTAFLLYAFGIAASLAVGAYLLTQGALSLGAVYLVFHYANLMQQPINEITRELEGVQQAAASIGRIRELSALKPLVEEAAQPAQAPAANRALSVQFDNVTFSYGEAVTLHEINLNVAPGQVLGLLGRTGSGKSTMARLLFRLYDVTGGAIRVDGVDIRQLKLDELRARVGMVTQEVQLFHASLRDNLTFFDRSIPDARILQVIDELGLRSWFDAQPRGLDTELQAGGSGLSAGEAQLLAFARVFLRDQRVVVLDEATSRLDLASERLIERAVDRLLAGHERTLIIIAHRLSTVQRADAILILEDGHIAEHGPRAALAANPSSRFSQLLRTGAHSELLAS
jgi:ATP-binding cassette, subfamily B, bacterial